MINYQQDTTDLRLLLPEVIWLESEHFQSATRISNQIQNESQQWQVYLNSLALCALEQWLTEKNPSGIITPDTKTIEPLSYLTMGEFRYATIATENLHDEVVQIPKAVISELEASAHFYVLLEISEEEEEAVLKGFIRHDQLDGYCGSLSSTLDEEFYQVPLSLFNHELNHLSIYSSYMDASSIALPQSSTEMEKVSESTDQSVETERGGVTPAIQDTITKATNLSSWLQGVFEDGWTSMEALMNPEANLAWSTRDMSEGIRASKLINLGIQLGNETVGLLVIISPESFDRLGVLVQLHPTQGKRFLVPDLELNLLSKMGNVLQSTRSRSQDNYIQLKPFKGKPGICFTLEVKTENIRIAEDFVL